MSTEQLWTDASGALRGFIRARVSDDATADDLLQEVFMRAHERRDQLRDQELLVAWLYRIARNAIVDHYRRRRDDGAQAERLLHEMGYEEGSETEALSDEQRRASALLLGAWARARIDGLPEPYREALVLTEVEGLSQRDAADRAGVAYSTMKSRVQRGRDRLHSEILACCAVELDSRGGVIGVEPRPVGGGGGDCKCEC
jgi:RNA polymerase sigma-70 factor (ECF subfamily)